MASQTEENYLKSLYSLAMEKGEVNLTDLSSLMKVRLPTVNSMIKNLDRQGFVNYEKYKPVSLTEKGKKEAALILRKHRLTEMYLVTKMGFGWEEVHDIAEQLEHIASTKLFDRMDELLEYPKTDPHGSQIPDKDGHLEWKILEKLSECKTGDRVKLIALSHSTSDLLNFLNLHDLFLGTELEIKSIEQFDKSMVVNYDNHLNEMFSQMVCNSLLIEHTKLM